MCFKFFFFFFSYSKNFVTLNASIVEIYFSFFYSNRIFYYFVHVFVSCILSICILNCISLKLTVLTRHFQITVHFRSNDLFKSVARFSPNDLNIFVFKSPILFFNFFYLGVSNTDGNLYGSFLKLSICSVNPGLDLDLFNFCNFLTRPSTELRTEVSFKV